jgi:ATP-dependent exoDNAse (exonuclease V) beta subunit/RecB family exonuclease
MAAKLLAITERVPGPNAAIQLQSADEAVSGRPVCRSAFVHALAEAVSARGRKAVLLVGPTRRVARQWIDTIARTGTPVFNVHVTTPKAMCFEVAAEALAAAGLAVASRQAKLTVVESVLSAAFAKESLRYFPRPPSVPRLAERILATLSTLRMADLSASAVRDREPFGETPKGHDIAYLLASYDEALKAAQIVDEAGVAKHARQVLAAEGVPGRWDVILLPEGLELKKLERTVFAILGDRVNEVPIAEPPASFADPSSRVAVHFSQAVGEANEIRAVLRRCVQEGIRLDEVELLHTDDATYPPLVDEILAVTMGEQPSTQPDTRPGTQVSGQPQELPVTFAEGIPIRGSHPARGLSSWLAWRGAKHPRWMLVRMLRDGLIAWRSLVSKEGVSRAGLIRELSRLAIDLHQHGSATRIREVLAGLEQAPLSSFVSQSAHDEDDPEFDEEAAQEKKARRTADLSGLAELVDAFFACEPDVGATAPEILDKARCFLQTIARASTQFDNNARNALVAEISDRERWLSSHPSTQPSEIIEWLQGLVDTLVVMGSGPRPGCLHVASIASGGHSGRPVTFIVGLDEARFPRAHDTDPVLPDPDRTALSSELETSAVVATRARASFWQLLGRLRGEVHLSFSCRDLVEHADRFPSPVVLEAYRRKQGSSDIPIARFLAAVAEHTEGFIPRDHAAALTRSEWWLSQLGDSPSIEAVEQAMRNHRGAALIAGHHAEAARRSPEFTAWDGDVPQAAPVLDPAAPDGRPASAHSLESLGACPRRFLFRYGLDVRPSDTLVPAGDRWLDALERGRAMHTVLERFMRRFLENAETPPDPPHPVLARDQAALAPLIDEVLAELEAVKPTADAAARDREQRELACTLSTFLKAEERYCRETGARPVALEAAIGLAPKDQPTAFDSRSPIPIEVSPNRHVRLRGFVDRIDRQTRATSGHAYSIVDYKNGSSSVYQRGGDDPLAVFDGGRRLQHGLYVLMVRHVARENVAAESTVATFSYLFHGPKGKGECLEWAAGALEGVATIVDRLCNVVAAGAFLPTSKPDDCKYCDYLRVCGDPKTTAANAARMLADPRLAAAMSGLRAAARPPAQGSSPISRVRPQDFDSPSISSPADPSDAQAREAIRNDLQKSFSVHASAGTGKTACLVDRMVALIRSGAAAVGEIVAITFTKKAAAELARRFREQLEKAAAESAADALVFGRLTQAIADLDSAIIGTVHSFCGRLLRERPIEAGLDPAVEMLDAAQEAALLGRAWREFCDQTLQDATLAQLRSELQATGVELADLRSAFPSFVAQADVQRWPATPASPPDVADLMASICGEIEQWLPDPLPPRWSRGSDEAMTALEAIRLEYRNRANDEPATLMAVADACDGPLKNLTRKLWWPNADARQKKAHAAAIESWWHSVQSRVREPLEQWRAYRYHLAMPLLQAARNHFDNLRLSLGRLSFSDLLVTAAKLLREKPEVRCDFARRYRFLFVDEFQDTDPIQAEIIVLLTAADPLAAEWRTAKVSPGRLFVVGDPQQSIYRFRRASIDVFDEVTKRITDSGGELLHLTTNFRTTEELVAWVNGHFPARFTSHRGSQANCGPLFTPSSSGRKASTPGVLSGLRRLHIEGKDVEAEAQEIATFIRRAIDNHLTVSRTEEEVRSGIGPTCRAGDFLIVTGDTGKLSTYAHALHAAGLSCDVTGRKGVDAGEDLGWLKLCLQVAADPDDAVAALALLRGPLFGFSDAELFELRQAGARIHGRLAVPEAWADSPLGSRFGEAAEAFQRWSKMAASLPLAAAVEAIAHDAGVFLVASAAEGRAGRTGRAAAGSIMTLIERVRAERHILHSIQDVLDRIDDLVSPSFPKQDFDTTSLDIPSGGSVRVMNLHQVKGLEAPVVFLCDYDGAASKHPPSWHVSRAAAQPLGYLVVRRPLNAFGTAYQDLAAPQGWAALKTLETLHLNAETLRKEYVAGTRPGCCLVASVFTKKDGTANGGWHPLGVQAFDDLPELPEVPAAAGSRLQDDAALGDAMMQATDRVRAMGLATYGTVTPRHFLSAEPAQRLRHSGDGLGEAWGTVIHLLLELALRNEQHPRNGFDLAAVAASALAASELAGSGQDIATLAEQAVELVQEVQRQAIWKQIHSGGPAGAEYFMEVPFSIFIEPGEVGPNVKVDYGPAHEAEEQNPPAVLVRGQIDLIFRDGSQPPPADMSDWMVLDWKTTSVLDMDREKLEASYRPQVRLYARCWAVK